MTTPPLPASPALRVRLDYTQSDDFKGGNRLYFTYAGSAPTAGNCSTIASDIAAAWASHIASGVHESWALTEVDVLDIASYVGLSGQWTGSNAGAGSGQELTASTAVNIEYNIARRYRGGKPRVFLPPPDASQLTDAAHWVGAFVTSTNANFLAFINEIEALTIGAVGALQHVNLSYYQGFKNITNSSGRERAVPQYRTEALVDQILGYATKVQIGSQKRRRAATSY